MTELDLEIPGLATEIINEYGKDLGYIHTPDSNYDPATSGIGAGVNPSVTIKGIVEPYHGQRMIAGLVEAEDLKVTCAAESFPETPTTGDIFTIDGEQAGVVNVMPYYCGELVAIYVFQVRR